MKKQSTLLTVTTAMLIALGILFPQIFHALPGGGTLFSPMHIPVLLCGLICGSVMGLIAGILVPIMSSLIFSMPPFPLPIIPMVFELAAYGFMAGMLMKIFSVNSRTEKIPYLPALIISMIIGRLIFVAVKIIAVMIITPEAPVLAVAGEALMSAFVSTWAGILLQIVLIPAIMFSLKRSHILDKYPFADRR